MTHNDVPEYDEREQGVEQDFRHVPDSTRERQASATRYTGSRQALIAQLNNGELAALPSGPLAAPATTGDIGPLHAVIYLRVSTEEQAKVGGTAEGYSIPYQRRACTEKAEALGVVIVEEYADLGESAKSAHRPELQRMLRELKKRNVNLVLVHKIDRLARNTRDDHEINAAIAGAGARLVSVSEHIDDTPAGRLNYTIQAGVAQYHSDNLKLEVMKGLTTKVQSGGTPYRTPLGYRNKQEITDNIIIRTVEIDPERAPLARWAFEQYATGDWTLLTLQAALTDKGLRTRKTAKCAAKPVSLNALHQLLRNPYYMGVVPYRGAYYDGSHPALVDVETWLQVQAVLSAHNSAGEKDREHPHYLKGSIFCGGCGARLIYSRNRGRRGGVYEYFVCLNRHAKRQPCTRRYTRVTSVEAGVAEFYRNFQLTPERSAEIRASVLAELSTEREQAASDRTRGMQRLASLTSERKAVLQAHYAGAIPLDLLKEEMDRLTREMADAERTVKDANKTVADLESTLQAALAVAGDCYRHYAEAPPSIRRQINQGFFTRLLIDQDGSVGRAEMTEPFAQLLTHNEQGAPEHTQNAPDAPGTVPATETPVTAPGCATVAQGGDRRRPTNVLVAVRESDHERTRDRAMIAGSKEAGLVPPVGFEPTLRPF